MTDTRILDLRRRIAELHGAGVLKKSALSIRGGGGAFEAVLGGGQYRTALEIGTYRGVSAAAMAQYCDRVITIDLVEGKIERMGERFDRQAFWRSLGLDNIELHLVRDDTEKAQLIAGMQFDFAFVDGDHGPSVRNDFELVKRCGAVLFHDYDRRGIADQDHVCNFIDTLPKHQVQVIDIFAFWKA